MGLNVIRKDSIRDLRLKNAGITPPKDWGDVEQVRAAIKQEIGLACSAAIYAGVDVGKFHYSLTEHDQTEIMAQYTTIKEGAGPGSYGPRLLSPHLLQPRQRLDCAGGH